MIRRSLAFQEMIAQASFIFTNGNPYIDFPHPTLHKTVMIGGFAVSRNTSEKHILSEVTPQIYSTFETKTQCKTDDHQSHMSTFIILYLRTGTPS